MANNTQSKPSFLKTLLYWTTDHGVDCLPLVIKALIIIVFISATISDLTFSVELFFLTFLLSKSNFSMQINQENKDSTNFRRVFSVCLIVISAIPYLALSMCEASVVKIDNINQDLCFVSSILVAVIALILSFYYKKLQLTFENP